MIVGRISVCLMCLQLIADSFALSEGVRGNKPSMLAVVMLTGRGAREYTFFIMVVFFGVHLRFDVLGFGVQMLSLCGFQPGCARIYARRLAFGSVDNLQASGPKR